MGVVDLIKKPKAIETIYNGYRFRSRLEARWAVFFDTLGIKYDYEKEGFQLKSGWYLPDFYLPELNLFVEIKSREYSKSHHIELWDLCQDFISDDSHHLYICGAGIPTENETIDILEWAYDYKGCLIKDSDMPYLWCECPECHVLGVQFDGRSGRNDHKKECSVSGDKLDIKNYNANSLKLLNAYEKARQARFEHGKNGL